MERFRYFLHLDHAAQAWCQLLVDGLSVSNILGLSTGNQQNIKTERFLIEKNPEDLILRDFTFLCISAKMSILFQ